MFPDRKIYRFLDTVGDGSGTKNAIGKYSDIELGATDFLIKPPAGQVFIINRMVIQITDGTTVNNADKYGGMAALTNGWLLKVKDISADLLDLTNGLQIKSNGHIARYCFDLSYSAFASGTQYIDARWTFGKSGSPLFLHGNNDEKLVITLNDDMDGLTGHYFMVQGYIQ